MLHCSWLITVRPGHVVEIGINSMNSDNDCLKDQLSIFDGPNIAGREIARLKKETIFITNFLTGSFLALKKFPKNQILKKNCVLNN